MSPASSGEAARCCCDGKSPAWRFSIPLFGSRARGDYRHNSDSAVLLITGDTPTDSWLETTRQIARRLRKAVMPEASGIDIICMSETDFPARCRLRNNMANTILKEGLVVMPDENLEFRINQDDEEVDWQDVEQKMTAATGAADWISSVQEAGILDAGDDMQFGIMAQNALEFACKAVMRRMATNTRPAAVAATISHSSLNSSGITRLSGRTKKYPARTTGTFPGSEGQQSTPTSTRP